MYLRLFFLFFFLLAVYLIIRAVEIVKRKKDRSKTDLQLLKPRKTSIVKEYDISDNPDDMMQIILNDLEQHNPKMLRSSNDEALVYFDTGEAMNEGMLVTPDEKMPVRIILKKKHKKLLIQIDEDYRHPMLVKTGKKILNKKYENTFKHYLEIIEKNFEKDFLNK